MGTDPDREEQPVMLFEILVAWFAVAVVVALLLGAVIRRRDRSGE